MPWIIQQNRPILAELLPLKPPVSGHLHPVARKRKMPSINKELEVQTNYSAVHTFSRHFSKRHDRCVKNMWYKMWGSQRKWSWNRGPRAQNLFHAAALTYWSVSDHPHCDSDWWHSKTTVVVTNRGFQLGNKTFVDAGTDEDRSSGTNRTHTKQCTSQWVWKYSGSIQQLFCDFLLMQLLHCFSQR